MVFKCSEKTGSKYVEEDFRIGIWCGRIWDRVAYVFISFVYYEFPSYLILVHLEVTYIIVLNIFVLE